MSSSKRKSSQSDLNRKPQERSYVKRQERNTNVKSVSEPNLANIPTRLHEYQRKLDKLQLPPRTVGQVAQIYVDERFSNKKKVEGYVKDVELNEDAAIPFEVAYGAKHKETGCCGRPIIRKTVDRAFHDPVFKKRFAARVQLYMLLSKLPANLWTIFLVFTGTIHDFLINDALLYFLVSFAAWVGFNIVGRLVHKRNILLLNFCLRAISLANCLASFQIFTELIVLGRFYKVPDFPNATEIVSHMKLNHANMVNLTLQVSPQTFVGRRYSRGYIGALILLSCTVSTLSVYCALVCFGKWIIHIPGYWMPVVGIVGAFSVPICSLYTAAIFKLSKGPPIWDICQIFFSGVCAVLDAVLLTFRWKRLFEGRIMNLKKHDELYVSFFFSA